MILSVGRHKKQEAEPSRAGSMLYQMLMRKSSDENLECGVSVVSGILRFESVYEMKEFLRRTLELYRADYEAATEEIGEMYRTMGEKAAQGSALGSWTRVGQLFVDSTDPEKGKMEVTLQLLTEMKPRIARLEEVMAEFNHVEELPVKPESGFFLCVRNGMPEKLIVDSKTPRPAKIMLREQYDVV